MESSSLRNAVHRRQHKERGQLNRRKNLGLLEKHKDYVERARDYNSKKERLKRLGQKAMDKNEDEFYFGMIKSRTEGGVHIANRETSQVLPRDEVALLKTQDSAYIVTQIRAEKKRMEKLVQRIAPMVSHMRGEWLDAKAERRGALRIAGLIAAEPRTGKRPTVADTLGHGGRRTVWVEGVEELRAYKPLSSELPLLGSPAAAASSAPETRRVGSIKGQDDDEDEDEDAAMSDDDASSVESDEASASLPSRAAKKADQDARAADRKTFEKHASALLAELQARQVRLKTLESVLSKLSTVRALISTSKSGGTSARKVRAKEANAKEAVAAGGVAGKHGLSLATGANGDNGRSSRSIWRWSKERKR
ncbi:Uncharacterized conserved protein [Ceraceosorus bombacis]|uniref:Uncharacterized conserved protein n=1 Tax=Ceraceosorus bombacis TaxID=401625 RepID=A0A0P1BNP5_9BASI|nr:Uncharacterized conserved protein [Ceraceosorus bombacis]